jgi:hypothetical protein
MGIFGAIADGVVAIRYDVNVDKAVEAVKGLSGEQKKAAKETVEAYKKEREEFKAKVQEFGKGAAIIGGALLVARSGLKAYAEGSGLAAGAAGVSIDDLSKAYDGLRTRTELLTLAQAGHQGAWKLTTGQLEKVIGGMRALEKKGFDSQQVFEKFTDVIKKGKLEGLDDFGLSLKATGDQTQDLKVLMNALGSEVLDVGGNFAKAGDAATRATAQMSDGLTRLRVTVGKLTDGILDMAAAMGRGAAAVIFGSLPDDVGPGGKASAYAGRFRSVRGIGIGGKVFDTGMGPKVQNLFDQRMTSADEAAGRTLAEFSSGVRQGILGRGPLATKTPEEFARIVAGLPQDWQKVDAELAQRVNVLSGQIEDRFATVGASAARGIWNGLTAAADKNREDTKRGRSRGGGRVANDNLGPGLFFGAAGRIVGAVDALAGLEDARAAGAAAAQARLDALGNAGMSSDISDAASSAAQIQDAFAKVIAEQQAAESDEQSFLERTFGKLEEFDHYAAAFGTLKNAVTDGFAAWIDGSESLGDAIKKSIAGSLRAYAVEMAGKAVVAAAMGVYSLAANPAAAPGYFWSAAKFTAAAGTLGYMAKELGGAGGGSTASSAAGVPSRNASAAPAQSGVVIVGDPLSDDSPRERARRVRRAMNAAGRNANEGVRYG